MAEEKRKDNKEKENDDKSKLEIDFGLGKLSLAGIFDGIEKLASLAEKVEKAGGEIKKFGEIKGLGGKEGARGVYGFTIRTGIGKKGVRLEPFGNIRATKEGAEVTKAREPIADVFDEQDHVLVIVELPGIDESTINLTIKEDVLILEAGSDERKYAKEILLPAKIDSESKEMKFQNGVLELKFKKSLDKTRDEK